MTAETHEDRWALAQSVLDGVPTATTERLLRGTGRRRLVVVVGLVIAVGALGLVVGLLLGGDGHEEPSPVATWRVVVGFGIGGLGLLFMVVALVVQFRTMRPLNAWRGPMNVLTRQQRKDLLRQIRGRAQVVPERIPLARHLAELLLLQRFAVLPQVGLMVSFVGQWIADPSDWRLVLTGSFAVMLLVYGVVFHRQAVRMRRFLDEHPAPAPPPVDSVA